MKKPTKTKPINPKWLAHTLASADQATIYGMLAALLTTVSKGKFSRKVMASLGKDRTEFIKDSLAMLEQLDTPSPSKKRKASKQKKV